MEEDAGDDFKRRTQVEGEVAAEGARRVSFGGSYLDGQLEPEFRGGEYV